MAKETNITFAIYELYSDGTEYDTGKTFSISKKENDEIMNKFGYGPSEKDIDNYGIVLTMFHKIYGFTIGLNGFSCIWNKDENGNPKTYEEAMLHWIGPREPACRIGGNWWKIKRIN